MNMFIDHDKLLALCDKAMQQTANARIELDAETVRQLILDIRRLRKDAFENDRHCIAVADGHLTRD